ncbi:MAG: hypothetical protein HC853_18360 [Anaerolineae bacterium]|nr:hypothetical protein [Anaerolineae bacterium]
MISRIPNAVRVDIDAAMRARAAQDAKARQMQRTRASGQDSYIGTLGELTWAKLRYGDWRTFDTLHTKGQSDDTGPPGSVYGSVEVKTSKTRLSSQSHLMVREDYAHKRQPAFYVLVLIGQDQKPQEECEAYVCGWATHAEVVARPPRERISRHTQAKQGLPAAMRWRAASCMR